MVMADNSGDVPIDQVRKMKEQGMSDNSIVETLQRDGYRSSQIFDAMTQADMKPADEVKEVTDDFPEVENAVRGSDKAPSPPQNQPDPPQPQPSTSSPPVSPGAGYTEDLEELVESVIDEKWADIEEDIKKVVDWKKDTEKRINSMQKEIKDLRERFDKLHEAVIGKIGDYDENIMNVGAEIKAMEKAFSKIIPEFSESVSELADLVEDLKEEKE